MLRRFHLSKLDAQALIFSTADLPWETCNTHWRTPHCIQHLHHGPHPLTVGLHLPLPHTIDPRSQTLLIVANLTARLTQQVRPCLFSRLYKITTTILWHGEGPPHSSTRSLFDCACSAIIYGMARAHRVCTCTAA